LSLVLRKIRKSKWYKHSGVSWLPAAALQADALSDLATKDNTLSIYLVKDESEAERVVAALAACSDYVSVFDYVLLDEIAVHTLMSKLRNNPGKTPDALVNSQHHRDLVELTTDSLLQLASAIRDGKIQRKSDKDVARLLTDGVKNGNLKTDELKSELRSHLLKYEPKSSD
jgi:hypothetical protein